MPQIQLLDQQTIDQIAAGEVIERPGSIIKELIENAMDAGADHITAEVQGGGISFVRVTDNGCGISSDQLRMAFCRHSTSKIKNAADLSSVSTLGFRGEALSSIAAVARVEMITKTAESIAGSRYIIEGGTEREFSEAGAPDGTTILVRDLFYNVPARRKFLHTAGTETAHITDLMEYLALSHPEVAFQYIADGRIRLQTSGSGSLKDVIYAVYGREIAASLLPVQACADALSLQGFIGKPEIARGNRSLEITFLNGRYIKSRLLFQAIEEGCRGYFMQHRYPFAVLSVQMDGALVDVNVHPAKLDVRFLHEKEVRDSVTEAVREAFAQKELIAQVGIGRDRTEAAPRRAQKPRAPEPFEGNRLNALKEAVRADSPYEKKYTSESHRTYVLHDSARTPIADNPSEKIASENISNEREPDAAAFGKTGEAVLNPQKEDREECRTKEPPFADEMPKDTTQQKLWDEERSFLSADARKEHRVIGSLFDTYWLIEYQDSLFLIDQHAAHEKVLYERLMKRYRMQAPATQMISPPMILELRGTRQERMKACVSHLRALGFEIEPFGEDSWSVGGIPSELNGLSAAKELLTDLLDDMTGISEGDTPERIADKLASMSCKAAVKGQRPVSEAEARHLVDELMTLENPYFCPHGRPVIIAVTRTEIEKKFKRI